MKTVHEVSEASGISIRALHHYDAIGLLKPSEVTEAGYRLYDEEALRRLQVILMFRELGFALSDIKQILDCPDFDLPVALREHIEMLKLQRAHIDGLISAATNMMKGENAGFAAFDRSKMEQYAEEVKAKWGKTDAYREFEGKLTGKTSDEKNALADGLNGQFVEFGRIKHLCPDSDEAQNAVKSLQNYISKHYYTCTKEILSGLGEMYVSDNRFRENIDKAGGDGTAEFVEKAIRFYCK